MVKSKKLGKMEMYIEKEYGDNPGHYTIRASGEIVGNIYMGHFNLHGNRSPCAIRITGCKEVYGSMGTNVAGDIFTKGKDYEFVKDIGIKFKYVNPNDYKVKNKRRKKAK